jgi:hypothetical protein
MAKSKNYKVKVKIGDTSVEVEGAESGVVEIVKALSDVLTSRTNLSEPSSNQASPIVSSSSDRLLDIRSFFEQKKPRSHIEAATTVAFYFQNLAPSGQRRDSIDKETLEHGFRQARWKLPKVIGQILIDAKKAGYFDSAGASGAYKLSPVGYNLVEHTLGSGE